MHDQNSDDSICIGPAAVQDQNSDDSICIGPANSDDSLCIGQEIAGVQDLLDSDLREERIFRAVEEGQTELLEGCALGTGTSPKQGSRAPIVRQTCRGSFSAGARFSVNFCTRFPKLTNFQFDNTLIEILCQIHQNLFSAILKFLEISQRKLF